MDLWTYVPVGKYFNTMISNFHNLDFNITKSELSNKKVPVSVNWLLPVHFCNTVAVYFIYIVTFLIYTSYSFISLIGGSWYADTSMKL